MNKYLASRVKSEIQKAFPGKNIRYDKNFSPFILNGLKTLVTVDNHKIIVFFETDEDIVWNEKNQSDKVFYEQEIKKYQDKLSKVSEQAIIFEED